MHVCMLVCSCDRGNLRQGLRNNFKVRARVGPDLTWPTCRTQWARLME
jgi:hypothetical protein